MVGAIDACNVQPVDRVPVAAHATGPMPRRLSDTGGAQCRRHISIECVPNSGTIKSPGDDIRGIVEIPAGRERRTRTDVTAVAGDLQRTADPLRDIRADTEAPRVIIAGHA